MTGGDSKARWWRVGGVLALLVLAAAAPAVHAQDAASLRERQAALRGPLAASAFGQPLVLESVQSERRLQGDVYAVLAQPFATVAPALGAIAPWCDVLMLHQNVKHCRARDADATLSVAMGRKYDQPLDAAYRIEFAFRVAERQRDYLRVELAAPAGPLGTTDYRLAFEAMPIDARSSFVHLSYAHGYGALAHAAMDLYLATIARDKVGFSVVGRRPDGTPRLVGGVRGVVERNAMRYHFALEAYLGALALPEPQRAEQRLQLWWSFVERHPKQLREMSYDEYLAMKRRELARQRDPAAAPR